MSITFSHKLCLILLCTPPRNFNLNKRYLFVLIDGEWDLSNFHLLDLGRPLYSVRCMTIVDKYVWCGYKNCIHVVDTETLEVVVSAFIICI